MASTAPHAVHDHVDPKEERRREAEIPAQAEEVETHRDDINHELELEEFATDWKTLRPQRARHIAMD